MAEEWWPTPADIKAHIPTRFQGRPFSEDTRPSITDVERFIRIYASEVAGAAGGPLEVAEHKQFAADVVSIGAAARVELAIDPEQATVADSVYNQLHAEYLRLLKSIKGIALGLAPGSGDDRLTGTPSHSFPEAWPDGSIGPERYTPISREAF